MKQNATHCNTLQHTATHCITLQYIATHYKTHCNTLQHIATHYNTLTYVSFSSTCDSGWWTKKMLRYTRELQCVAVCCSVLQCVAVCCSVLQSYQHSKPPALSAEAVCCSVLQCVAAYCSVLQRVAVIPAFEAASSVSKAVTPLSPSILPRKK